MDLAAIYEWLTKKKAGRGVDSILGIEIGPFWDFVVTIWPVIFKSTGAAGLPATINNWAGARNKYDEESPLISNMSIANPAWGLFDLN